MTELLQKASQVLKVLIMMGILSITVCASVFLWQLKNSVIHLDGQTALTLSSIQTNLNQISGDVKDVKVMLNATLFQAEEVLHHADILVATESKAQSAQLIHINAVLSQLQDSVANLDVSEKRIASSITQTVDTIPAVAQQLQSTLETTQQTIASTGEAVDNLTRIEESLNPTIEHINSATDHLDSIAASLDTVVKNATKPQPLYKKVIGYIWAPIKIAAIFTK